MKNHLEIFNSQKGVAMLELTIFFGFLAVISGGVFTLITNLHNANIASIAARRAARAGAGYSILVAADPLKFSCTAPSVTSSCPYAAPLNDPTVSEISVAHACDFLENSGLTTTGWTFTGEIVGPLLEDKVSNTFVQVTASRAGSSFSASWGNLLSALQLNTRSIFVLERTC